MISFNQNQKTAIKSPLAPLLILAGAGTGKTSTIIARIAHIVQNCSVDPESILALTFSNKSAEHLKENLHKEIGDKALKIYASTFHSFAKDQIFDNFKDLGYKRLPKIATDADIYFLLQNNLNKLPIFNSENFNRSPIKAIKSLKALFDAFRQNLFDEEDLAIKMNELLDYKRDLNEPDKIDEANQLIDAINIFPIYQKLKKDYSWIDYSDMILNLWHLIKNNSKGFKNLKERFKHIIVDEYQDNNYALSRITEKICEPDNSITVVGDDDQCIYAFRQANIQTIQYFYNKYYKGSNRKPVYLLTNYRSNQPILDLANKIIKHNVERFDKGNLNSNINKKVLPKLFLGTKEQQVAKMAIQINNLFCKGVETKDIVVLVRTNIQGKYVYDKIRKLGVHANFNSKKLFELSKIKDVVSIINLIHDSKLSNQAIIRLIGRIVNRKIIADLINDYHKNNDNASLFDFCLESNNELIQSYAIGIANLKKKCKNLKTGDLVWEVFRFGNFYNSDHKTIKNLEDVQALNSFYQIALDYDGMFRKSRKLSFVNYINLKSEINDDVIALQDVINESLSVKIMTIHNSKGLEFKHVLIPFLSSGSIPQNPKPQKYLNKIPLDWQKLRSSIVDKKQLHYEEECRILYVGITRAMESITLFSTKKRQSRFLKNIENEILRKDIMYKREEIKKEDELIIDYQNKLVDEVRAGNYDAAYDIISILKNIDLIKKGKNVKWGINSYAVKAKNTLYNKNTLKRNNRKPLLSATSIQTYVDCPLKYKYQYIDRIPQRFDKAYLKLGTVIHKVLELFHKNKYNNRNQLYDLFETEWKNMDFHYKQEEFQYKNDAILMLDNYSNYIKGYHSHIAYYEFEFEFETSYAVLRGKCDRVEISKDNEISIIDYKTSNKSKTPKQLLSNIQLGLYALFSKKSGFENKGIILKKIPEKLIALFLREESPSVEISISNNNLNDIEDVIKNVAEGLSNNNFTANKGHPCEFCDYKYLNCSEWK